MELGRAISYIFEDKQWVTKLLPLLVIGILSAIPIFGLIAAAVALGFMVQLAQNVREGLPRPLPKWDDLRVKLEVGGQVLLAMIAYNLPLILMSMCSYTLISGVGGSFLGSASTLLTICCTLPIAIVYSVISWSMLAIGVSEYIETGESRRLYRFGHLWDVLQTQNKVVFQWAIMATLVNIVFGLIAAIPCIGWLVFILFAYPVHGHLFGQFAHRLSVKNKPQKRRAT